MRLSNPTHKLLCWLSNVKHRCCVLAAPLLTCFELTWATYLSLWRSPVPSWRLWAARSLASAVSVLVASFWPSSTPRATSEFTISLMTASRSLWTLNHSLGKWVTSSKWWSTHAMRPHGNWPWCGDMRTRSCSCIGGYEPVFVGALQLEIDLTVSS